jgi:site-specific DNA-cytosine methylase
MGGLIPMPHPPLQSIDLFAGCGGLSTGWREHWWQAVEVMQVFPAVCQ